MTAPTIAPVRWATDTNYASGPRSGSPTKDTAMTAGVAAQGIVAGQSLKADQVNQALYTHGEWLTFLRNEQGGGVFGDGSDGAGSIAGSTSLSRDMYYTDLDVDGVLTTNGYRVFVSGTLTGTGTIRHNGANASGQTAGAGAASGSISGVDQSAGEGDGSSGGAPGTAGYAHADSIAGAGGAGGADGAQAGGTGGTVATTASRGGARHFYGQLGTFADGTRLQGGAGGGGGGATSGTGGGGGGGGGVIAIIARAWDFTGTIQAIGGNGGAGDTAGGGGGGGGGGTLLLAYRELVSLGTTQVTGGSGGAGAGGGGVAGSPGSAGTVLQFVV